MTSVVISALSAESLTVKELNRIGNERQNIKSRSYSDTIKQIRKHGKVISLDLDKGAKSKLHLPPIGKPFDPKAVDAIRGEIKRETPFKQHKKIEKRYQNLDIIDGKPVPKKLSDEIQKSVVTPVGDNDKNRVPRAKINDIFTGKTIKIKEINKRERPKGDKRNKKSISSIIKDKTTKKSTASKPSARKGYSEKTETNDKGVNPWDLLKQKLKNTNRTTKKVVPKKVPSKKTIKKVVPKKPTQKKNSIWENLKKKVTPKKVATKKVATKKVIPEKTTKKKNIKKKAIPTDHKKKTKTIKSTDIKSFQIRNSVTQPKEKHTSTAKKYSTPAKEISKPKVKKSSWWNKGNSIVKPSPVKTKKYIFKKSSDQKRPPQLKGLIYKKNTVKKAPTPKRTYHAPSPAVKKNKKATTSSARKQREHKSTDSKVFNSYLNKFNMTTKPKPIKRFKTERGSGSRTGTKIEPEKVVPQKIKPKTAPKPNSSSRRKNGTEKYKASFRKLVI